MCVEGGVSPHRRLSIPRRRWVGEAWVQVRLSSRPHPFPGENRVGPGRPCRATGPGVRGDNKQGPVSRDRREGRHRNELPGAPSLLPGPRAGPTAPGGREQLVPNTPPATALGPEVRDISLPALGASSQARCPNLCRRNLWPETNTGLHGHTASTTGSGLLSHTERSSCTRAQGRSKPGLLPADDQSPLPTGGGHSRPAPAPRKGPGCPRQQGRLWGCRPVPGPSNDRAGWEVRGRHYRNPVGHLRPQASPDRAEGGAQRQGDLVLGSETVVGAPRTALPARTVQGATLSGP